MMQLLRAGATPSGLAWSVAVGFAIGVNPLLGSTTLLALAAVPVFRLNLVASQLACHLSYPLELLLFPVFIELGDRAFHSPRMPVHGHALLEAVRHHPWDTTRLLWTWEWHALVVWAVAAAVVVPLLQWLFCRLLLRLMTRQHGTHMPSHELM
jgi:uncharacterized protein (DUF2062 family)